MRATITTLALSLSTIACAQAPLAAPPRPEHVSDGPLVLLDYFIGDWEIEATWAWGATLRARNEYRVGLGGNIVEVTTIVQDNDGPIYERYLSFYTTHNGDYTAIGLTYDGSFSQLPYTLENDGESIALTTDSTTNGTRLRQRFETDGPDTYTWKAWMTPAGSDTEQLIMDGVWRRVTRDAPGSDDPWASSSAAPTNGPRPINPALFVAQGADLRSFTEAAQIDAPPSDVFDVWATAAGWESVYAAGRPEADANIDLAIGGRYEWLFDGALGSNGCQVLSYIPNRMISFTWNAPPDQPENRAKRTWVVVELDGLDDDRTMLTLTHLGFGDAEAWDETEAYFRSAWPRVLGVVQGRFAAGD